MERSTGANSNIQSALQLIRSNDWQGAAGILKKILSVNPRNPDALHLMGVTAYQAGMFQSAIDLIEAAIRIKPHEARYYNDCGEAYRRMGESRASIARFRRTLALDPNFWAAYNNLGSAFLEEGKIDEAIASFRHVIQRDPRNGDAHWNLSLALLLTGNFKEGWEEYEWRWESGQKRFTRNFCGRQWDGETIENRTLLLHCEQGFGDALQFIRYVPEAQRRGCNVVVECRRELIRLFEDIPGISLIAYGEDPPPYDLHLPILSLPRAFGTSIDAIPADIPYLKCKPDILECWKQRIGDIRELKVGLAWAGNPTHVNDHNRSCPFDILRPILEVPGIRFFSLQKRGAQEQDPDFGGALVDYSSEWNDFADTAGLISQLDLIISVDTSVVHLAGALAKPVWTLLPYVPDWRWMLGREDSPWYPTMKLFRQPAVRDWKSVIQRVAGELSSICH